VFLAAGSHGICLRHVNLTTRYTNSTGTVTQANTEVTFSGGQSATAATPFSGAPIANRIFNGNLFYSVGSVPGGACATRTLYGSGCYLGADSWYENFAAGLSGAGAFDFAGGGGTEQVIAAGANAAGYSVAAGATSWAAPTGTPVLTNTATPGPMLDDSMSGPQTLPFAFAFPGGTTSVIHIASNGFIHLGPTTLTTSDFSPTVAEALTLEPRIFALWGDLEPSINLSTSPASGIYFQADPVNQVAYVTWLQVADRRGGVPAPGATSVNVQCALFANGNVQLRYGTIVPRVGGTGPVLVGVSKGNLNVSGGPTSVDPGNRDLSASMPFSTNAPDQRPLTLDSNLPRLGTNWTFTTSNVNAVSPIAITFLGTAPVDPGLDLGFLGAPNCRAYLNTIVGDLTAVAAGGTASAIFPIPSTPGIVGLRIVGQSVCLTTQNALNLQTSNGVDAIVGN
jgi:hypothetical protein